jgi:hypothetical protein
VAGLDLCATSLDLGDRHAASNVIVQAQILIHVDGERTYVTLTGEGIALEIAEELVEIARNMDGETFVGIRQIEQQRH